MRTWVRPMAVEENYTANQAVADSVTSCYMISCDVGGPKYPGQTDYSNDLSHWKDNEYGGVSHADSGTGNCHDAAANRVISDGMVDGSTVGEYNSKQGWITGEIDSIITGSDGKVSPGDRVYWHTFSGNKDRRWNHTGIIKMADANHPNHS